MAFPTYKPNTAPAVQVYAEFLLGSIVEICSEISVVVEMAALLTAVVSLSTDALVTTDVQNKYINH